MSLPTYSELSSFLIPLVLKAGQIILAHYEHGVKVEIKGDDSPVTLADQAAEACILEGLERSFPSFQVIAEEMCAAGKQPSIDNSFFLVDPLDGTKEFINNRDEFTVNIGFIQDGLPFYGVVFAPAKNVMYVTAAPDRALKICFTSPPSEWDKPIDIEALPFKEITVRDHYSSDLTAVVSRSHIDDEAKAFLSRHHIDHFEPSGSSLKFCLLAEGKADLYPRFSQTMEWDTAAGDAILRAAGGGLISPDGAPFVYGKQDQDFRNGGFIAGAKDYLHLYKGS